MPKVPTAAILAQLSDGVILTDASGLISYVNPEAERIHGVGTLGVPVDRYSSAFSLYTMDGEPYPSRQLPLARAVRLRESVSEERWLVRRPDGVEIVAQGSARPLLGDDGVQQGAVLTVRDVTAQFRMEQEQAGLQASLRESEQRLETTLRSIGDAVIVTDSKGVVTLMNEVAEDLTGWMETEACGRRCDEVFNIVNEFSRRPVESPVERVIRQGITVGLANHTILISRHGAERPIDDSGAPVYGPDGRFAGVVLVFRDVTARRKTERNLQQQAALLDLTAEAVFVHGDDNLISFWNQGAVRTYGWSREEAVGKVARELLRTTFPVSYEDVLRTVEREGIWEGELWHTCRDGRRIVVASRWSVQRDSDGNPLAILESNRDVTAQRETETALRESESRFRTIVEQSPFSIQVLSPDGKTVMVNRAWEELWGLTLEQLTGYNMLEDRQLEAKGVLPYILRGFRGEPTEIPVILYDPSETLTDVAFEGDCRRWVEASIYPVKDEAGEIRQVILVHQDVTDRMRAEEVRRAHTEEVTALNTRLQRAMLETHHRVKNNLQMIAAFIDLLKMDNGDTLPTRQLSHVGSQVKALSTVHDLLTTQAKGSGDAADLSARELLGKLIDSIRPAAPGRTIESEIQDARISARQSTSLAIVANELVTNAVKHSRGSVNIQFAVEDGRAMLSVTDDGDGFSPSFDAAASQGHGLGLIQTVARWDLQGKLSFGNVSGGGGNVTVTFPLPSGHEIG